MERYSMTRLGCVMCAALGAVAMVICGHILKPVEFLKPNEQLVVTAFGTITTIDGPQVAFYVPMLQSAHKRMALNLDDQSYATFKDALTGEVKIVAGPKLYFIGPYEELEGTSSKIILTDRQYVRLLDKKRGTKRLVRGPATFAPEPLETFDEPLEGASGDDDDEDDKPEGVKDAVKLEEMQYTIVTDTLSGAQRIEAGPLLLFPGVHETIGKKQAKVALKKHEFAKVVDEGTGVIRVVQGPAVLMPRKATERVGPKRDALKLLQHQWVKLVDQASGKVRVERGEGIIVPAPNEEAVCADGRVCSEGAVRDAVNVDDETAVLVVSKQSGQQRLVTQRGLFFPDKHDEIVEVRKLIRVQPHEVAIVRDNDGAYHFHSGNSSGDARGSAFFLQPHDELVTMQWSSGTSAEDVKNNVVRNAKSVKYKVPVDKIDLRSQFAFFEYTVRTSDNVELQLEGTIFWKVSDVAKMIERTADPKGDVWYHARSSLIQAVSTVTLETFMSSFNTIVAKAAAMDRGFYEERGVELHSLEVVRYECQDAATSRVLQEIIQETTNRINRLQKQRSENEVEREKVSAAIEIEKQRSGLIKEQTANEKLQASVAGESEGTRLAQSTLAFMEMLAPAVADTDARLALLKFFAEQKTIIQQSQRYANNPNLTTVIEGGATVKPLPWMQVAD